MRLSFKIESELREALMDYADEYDLSLPEAAREILSLYLLEEEELEETEYSEDDS